jgi:hypothetical protein
MVSIFVGIPEGKPHARRKLTEQVLVIELRKVPNGTRNHPIAPFRGIVAARERSTSTPLKNFRPL